MTASKLTDDDSELSFLLAICYDKSNDSALHRVVLAQVLAAAASARSRAVLAISAR